MLRAAVPVLFCVLVFFFALHAKTAVYGAAAHSKVTPSTASKMWVSGQKLQSGMALPHSVPFILVLFLSLLGFRLVTRPQNPSLLIIPASSNLRLRYLHRFLRPPPFQN